MRWRKSFRTYQRRSQEKNETGNDEPDQQDRTECTVSGAAGIVSEGQPSWAEGLSLKLVCGPGGAVLAVRKDEQHGLCRLSRAQHTDITMRFKTVTGAFRVLSGQIGISEAYARHLFSLEGDIYQTMSFVRCVEYLEAYLFPEFMSRRILREVPPRQLGMLQVYALAMLERV